MKSKNIRTKSKSKEKPKLSRLQKIFILIIVVIFIIVAQAYAIAFWYQKQHRDEPLNIGVTYIANYARYYGLDPQETMLALRDDLGFKRFRLVSYWKDIEKSPGQYDFTELDWQFEKVNEVGGQVSLAIGLRQPRWPECHAPEWVKAEQKDQWYPELKNFMAQVINRYKNNPALVSYQLENEYFLGVFGECEHYGIERERLIDEFNFVKSLDPGTPVILSYANNYFGVATGQPQPDQIGVSVYKRVFEETVTNRYFEYPFPSWYYSWRAGLQQILKGQDSMLHELQAEPWAPGGVKEASIEEQDKSMDAERLKERINYGVATGFRDIDLWGGEWWYWRKVSLNDDSLWEAVRQELDKVCSKENCTR
ncbi:MAG: beta-galactosidase [Patescibacteria group bacterium]|jgi:hypothetical protein|nr:beta-galactosidase [Patescibacteria group bacterium]